MIWKIFAPEVVILSLRSTTNALKTLESPAVILYESLVSPVATFGVAIMLLIIGTASPKPVLSVEKAIVGLFEIYTSLLTAVAVKTKVTGYPMICPFSERAVAIFVVAGEITISESGAREEGLGEDDGDLVLEGVAVEDGVAVLDGEGVPLGVIAGDFVVCGSTVDAGFVEGVTESVGVAETEGVTDDVGLTAGVETRVGARDIVGLGVAFGEVILICPASKTRGEVARDFN